MTLVFFPSCTHNVLQEKLLFNAYMFRLYIKSLLNHSAISNKKVICLLHTRLEYSNLNF